MAAIQITGRGGDPGADVLIEQEMLPQRLAWRQAMPGDDVS